MNKKYILGIARLAVDRGAGQYERDPIQASITQSTPTNTGLQEYLKTSNQTQPEASRVELLVHSSENPLLYGQAAVAALGQGCLGIWRC